MTLSIVMERAVVDRTGLTGLFDYVVEFASTPLPDSNAPALLTALEEQLGLKLESTRAPIEVLVVDRIERPKPD